MCGIVGFVDVETTQSKREDVIGRMLLGVSHRGPDGQGKWCSEKFPVNLGHCRLAIQDLSDAGRQPMVSENGRYIIVFNGEIYNFKELVKSKEVANYGFKGSSDTEVLLALIQSIGLEAALSRCTGMFGLALWDNQERQLMLARDRIGEKPLYYGWFGNGFAFASELAGITEYSKPSGLDIDKRSLSSFIRYGYVPGSYSIYRGVYKLKTGCMLRLDFSDAHSNKAGHRLPDEDPRICSYWSLSNVVSHKASNQPASLDDLENAIDCSVRRQLISDVPLGSFLSGGYDSSLISAIAAKHCSGRLNTYTIGFSESQYDESKFAREVSQCIGTNHHEMILSAKDALDVVPLLPSIYSEPFANPSQIPVYLVSKYASQEVKVCLSGDGGDELFAGYNRYSQPLKLQSYFRHVPSALKVLLAHAIASLPGGGINGAFEFLRKISVIKGKQANVDLKIKKIARFLLNPDLDQYYRYLISMYDTPEAVLLDGNERSGTMYEHFPSSISSDFIERAQFLDQLNYLPEDCLTKVDRASMAVGLEVRAPLLDHGILEESWRFSSQQKLNNGNAKWPLRKILYKYVPASIMDRPKMGFTVPIDSWLRSDLRPWAESLLSKENIERSACFNADQVQKLWKYHMDRESNNSGVLWSILMFLSWYDANL